MFAFLVVAISLFRDASSLTCDHLEYTYYSQITVSYPIGVCIGESGNGSSADPETGNMYRCTSDGDVYIDYYNSSDCSASSLYGSWDFFDAMSFQFSSYSYRCCGQPCDYIKLREYELYNCSKDLSTASSWRDEISVMNGCNVYSGYYSYSYTDCDNRTSYQTLFDSGDYCDASSGDAVTSDYDDGECNQDNANTTAEKTSVYCGTAMNQTWVNGCYVRNTTNTTWMTTTEMYTTLTEEPDIGNMISVNFVLMMIAYYITF